MLLKNRSYLCTRKVFISLMAIALAFLPLADIPFAKAAIPQTINYQSRLLTPSGSAVTSTTAIQFSFYLDAVAGSPSDGASQSGPLVWKEVYDQGTGTCSMITPDSGGYFFLQLGSCNPFPAYLDFSETMYVGVKVGSDVEATPRVQLASHPYALNAQRVNSLEATTTAAANSLLALDSDLNFNIATGTFMGGGLEVNGTSTLQNLTFTTATGTSLNLTDYLAIGAIRLDSTGTNNLTSGAYLLGVFDEFDNSNATTVQAVLSDLDTAITVVSSTLFTITLDSAYDAGGSGLGKSITTDAGPIEITNTTGSLGFMSVTHSTDAEGLWVNNLGNGDAFSARNQGSAAGFYSRNQGTGSGVRIDNNTNSGMGLYIDNAIDGVGLRLDNAGSNFGAAIYNNADGIGFHIQNSSPTGMAMYLRQNAGQGLVLDNNTANDGVEITNNSTGNGIYVDNQSSGRAIYVSDAGTKTAVQIDKELNGGNALAINTDNSAKAFYITHNGDGESFWMRNQGTGASLWIEDAASDSTPFVLNSSGFLGIGTSTPAYYLDVNGDARVTSQFMLGRYASLPASGYQSGSLVYNTGSSTINYWDGSIWRSVATAEDVRSSLWDTDHDTGVQVEESADEDIIRFDTAGVERMYIQNDGKIGVGTTAPLDALFTVGPGAHEPSVFSVYGDPAYYNIANFRDEDGESIFRANGSVAGGDLLVTFGDKEQAGNGTYLGVDYANDSINLSNSELRFQDDNRSNYVAFIAPASLATNTTWILPYQDGLNNQVLVTDGSGNLSWATSSDMVDNIYTADGSLPEDRTVNLNGNYLNFENSNLLVEIGEDEWIQQMNNGDYYTEVNQDGGTIVYSAGNSSSSALGNLNIRTNFLELSSRSNGVNTTNLHLDSGDILLSSDLPNFHGATYGNDYSAYYVDRSLVDKAYVDNKVASSTNNIYDADGNLAGDRTISSDGYGLAINPVNGGYFEVDVEDGTDYSFLHAYPDELEYSVNSSAAYSSMVFNAGGSSFNHSQSGSSTHFYIGSTMTLADGINFRGVNYADDYSANYTARTLVDKGYVDNAITSSTVAAGNALTLTSGVMKLGGDLTETTYINHQGYDLVIREFAGEPETLFAGDNFKIIDTSRNRRVQFGISGEDTSGLQWRGDAQHDIYYRDNALYIDSNTSTFGGMQYALDYSGNYTNRSLVDKAYVDSHISEVTLQGAADNSIAADGYVYFETGAAGIEDDGGAFKIEAQSGGYEVEMAEAGGTKLNFKTANGLNPASVVFSDARSAGDRHGIEYLADYSSDYTLRSLVDKAYVDSAIVAATTTLNAAYNAGGSALGRQIFTLNNANPVEILNPGSAQWETSLALTNAANGGGLAMQTMESFGDWGSRLYFTDNTSDPVNGTGAYMYNDNTMSAFEFGYQTAGTRNSSFYIDYNQMALNIPGSITQGAFSINASNYNVPVMSLRVPGASGSNQITINVGTSTPEAKVTAWSGSLFTRTDGVGGGEQLYVKTTDGGNTGWVPLSSSGSLTDLDGDTKIQLEESSDEDYIRFDTAGTERMYITNSGDLHFADGGYTNAYFNIDNPSNPYTGDPSLAGMFLDSGNDRVSLFGTQVYVKQNLGVGVLNPNAIVDIGEGLITNPRGDMSVLLTQDGGDSFFETASGDMAEGLVMQGSPSNGVDYGVIRNIASNGYAAGWDRGLHIFTSSTGVTEDPIILSTDSAERMRILDNGNVGIATSTPGYRLDVQGDSRVSAQFMLGQYALNPANGNQAGAMIYNTASSTPLFWDGSQWVALGGSGATAGTLWDTDHDTGVQVEESADDDTIRFDVAGTEYFTITQRRITPTNSGNSVFIGSLTGANDDNSANQNIFIGNSAGYSNTSGHDNILMGYRSGYNLTSGNENVYLGYEAGYSATTQARQVAIGYNAGRNNTGGYGNTMMGYIAGRDNTGNDNTMLGYESGIGNTGSDNFFMGRGTGWNNTGNSNIMIGYFNGYNNTGDDNVFFGNGAGSNNQGDHTILMGYQSGFNNIGDDNIFLGYNAGRNNATGTRNLFLGRQAGYSNVLGDGNVFLGYQAGYSETASDRLYIDNSNTANPLIYGEFDNDIVRVNGTMQVNNPATTGYAFPAADGASYGLVLATDANGAMYWSTTTQSNHLKKVTNVLSPVDSAVYQFSVTNNNANTLTGFKAVNTNDVSNYAGAVLELKGSGADYTNNLYFGKYGSSFYVPSWAGNGVLATDKNLVIGSLGTGTLIRFQVGGGYTTPATVATLDSDSLDLSAGVSLNVAANAKISSQFMLGQYALNPVSGIQSGSVIYNTASSTPFFWDGSNWIAFATGTADALNLQQVTDNGYITDNSIVFAGATSSGDIIPGGNNAYALGNTNYRWSDVWGANVHIGTSTWDLAQSADGSLTVASGGSEKFRVQNNGYFGVGTNQPEKLFSLGGGDMLIGQFDGAIAPIGGYSRQMIIRATDGQLAGTQGTAYTTYQRNGVDIAQIGIDTSNNIAFRNNDGAWNTDVVIASSGNMGIGDTAPTRKLDIAGGKAAGDNLFRVIGGPNDAYVSMYADTVDDRNSVIEVQRDLDFYSQSTRIMTLRNSGDVGIGTNNPDNNFHVFAGDSGGSSLANTIATFENNDHAYMQFLVPNDKSTGILFGDNDSANIAGIFYTHSLDMMQFRGNNDVRANIDSSGHFTLNNGVNPGNAILDVRGDAIFNEDGDDYDFRVEGSSSTHALFVDGANGNVGFDQSAPLARLHVGNTTAGSAADYPYMRLQGSGDVDHSLYLPTGSNLMVWDFNMTGNGGAFEFRNYGSRIGMFTNSGLVINDGGASDIGLRVEGRDTANLIYTDASNNRVGIGTGSPSVRLDVVQDGEVVAAFDRTTNDGTIISLRQDGTEEGTISVSGNTVSYNAFTGSHYAWTDSTIAKGMLVSLTGENKYLHNNPNSEILYGIQVTSVVNDEKVMGSYLALQESNKARDEHNPHLVMAVGNGDVWVADKGDNINIGDYLISSDIAGHAQKDTGEFIVSHIVARAAESIDWTHVSEQTNGVKHKKISVFFEAFDKNNIHASVAGTSLQGGDNLDVQDLTVGNAVFEGTITVKDHAAFGKDTVGQALIMSGEKRVKVDFENDYGTLPIITLTPASKINGPYWVENSSLQGFDIVVDELQSNEVLFNWHAFGNFEGRVSVSNGTTMDIEINEMGSSVLETNIKANGSTFIADPIDEPINKPTDEPTVNDSSTTASDDEPIIESQTVIPDDNTEASTQPQESQTESQSSEPTSDEQIAEPQVDADAVVEMSEPEVITQPIEEVVNNTPVQDPPVEEAID